MSSNRPLYDMCESKQAIVESVAPGNYRLNELRICNPCYPVDPHYRLQKIGNSLVEVDKLDLAKSLIAKAKEKGVNLQLPKDSVTADAFDNDAAQITRHIK